MLVAAVAESFARSRAHFPRTGIVRSDAGEGASVPAFARGRPLTTPDTKDSTIFLSVLKSIEEVPREEWDACVGTSTGTPFLSFGYLHALESSGSVDPNEGWMVQHLVAHDSGKLVGAVPLYLKSHSYGEYVFDHEWARAYRSRAVRPAAAGYYPKLQACVPFTPVTGARLLVADTGDAARRAAVRGILARGLVALADRIGVSSVHCTFTTPAESHVLRRAGFLPRVGIQYHWVNRGFTCFDDYLTALKQSRRKAVRQERRRVVASGLTIRRLRGDQIGRSEWSSFDCVYRATVEQNRGQDYLKRPFFDILGREMPDSVMLVLAEDASKQVVAGALHIIDDECIYGRVWGASTWHDSLHFELCAAPDVVTRIPMPR